MFYCNLFTHGLSTQPSSLFQKITIAKSMLGSELGSLFLLDLLFEKDVLFAQITLDKSYFARHRSL